MHVLLTIVSTLTLWAMQPHNQWFQRLPLGQNGQHMKLTAPLHLLLKVKD